MALKSTSKIRLFVSSEQEQDILSFLQEKAVMEVTSSRDEERSNINHTAEFVVSKLDFAINYLSQFAPEKKGLRNSVLGEKIELSEVEVSDILTSYDWNPIVEKITNLEVSTNDESRKLSEFKNQLLPLEIFENCDIKNISSRFSPLYFSVPKRNAEKAKNEIELLSALLEISKISETEKSVAFVVDFSIFDLLLPK